MANKTGSVLHGITASPSAEEMHHVRCPRRQRGGSKFKAKSPIDMLLNEPDPFVRDGKGATTQVTVVDYEPSFVQYLGSDSSTGSFPSLADGEQQYQPNRLIVSAAHAIGSDSIDFVTRLPYDLLCSILWHIDPSDLAEMTLVSHGWCCRLSDYATDCSQIDLSDNDDDVGTAYEKLTATSPHVSALSVMFLETSEPLDMLLSEIANMPFAALQSLDLGCMVHSADVVFGVLRQVKGTLQQLSLMCVSHDQALSLGTILSICSNLKCLQYSLSELQGADHDSFLPLDNDDSPHHHYHRHHPLQALQLVAQRIRGHELEPILSHCPNLQSLVVCECGPDAIDAIHQYMPPRLEYLHINPNLERTFPPWIDIEYSIPVSTKGHLHTVIAGNLDTTMVERLSRLLGDHGPGTLGRLEMRTRPNALADSDRAITIAKNPWYASASFAALRALVWNGFDGSWNDTLSSVVRQCSQLEDMTIAHCERVDMTAMDTIAGLTRLRKLALEHVEDTSRIPGLLTRFLEHHGSLRQDSSLEELRLVANQSILDPATLDALATVMTLRSISLLVRDTHALLSQDDMEHFTGRLASATLTLQKLVLAYLEDCVTDAAIQQLADIDGLLEVTFVDLRRITNVGVNVLLEACSSLQLLKVEGSPLVSYDVLAQIESKMMERAIRL